MTMQRRLKDLLQNEIFLQNIKNFFFIFYFYNGVNGNFFLTVIIIKEKHY